MKLFLLIGLLPFFGIAQLKQAALWSGCDLEDSVYRLDCSGEKFLDYVLENLQVPSDLKKDTVVQIKYTIDTLGNAVRINVIQSAGNKCDQEAIRLLKEMPKWIPGIDSDGNKIPVKYTIPIHFITKKED